MAPQNVSDWNAFEHAVADFYRELGAETVKQNLDMGGNQIDVYIEEKTVSGQIVRIAVECKFYETNVPKKDVLEFCNVAKFLRLKGLIDKALMVTSKGYTPAGSSVAETSGIELLTFQDLEARLGRYPKWTPAIQFSKFGPEVIPRIEKAVEQAEGMPAYAVPSKDPPTMSDDEEGEWELRLPVRDITGDSSEKDVQLISVDDARYTFHQGNVKIFFDFLVDFKKVPRGSALTIGGVPFKIDSRNVYEFKVRQTGLNHSEDLTVSARCGDTSFDLLYVTDGSEGSVRFWGYIVYKCGYYPP